MSTRVLSNTRFFFLLLSLTLLWACGSEEGIETAPESEGSIDEAHPALYAPALAKEQAPETFHVRFETTKGEFVVAVVRSWAPRGADRFYNLVRVGYLNDISFYRVLDGYIAQFGVNGDPEVNQLWGDSAIGDDPVKMSNTEGMLAFAQQAPNTRTTQIYINLQDNPDLDTAGLAPFGQVVSGRSTVASLYSGYGEMHPKGKGPRPNLLQKLGNKYLKREFGDLDYIIRAEIDPE
jgi:peptidyl-prolyl cis-trans isomerase A (cyclophilin A)